MPIYEYKCTECNHQLECIQKFSDAPLIECPSCKKPTLKKRVSLPSFQLKGNGWYETDFKNKKPQENSKPSKDEKTGKNEVKSKTDKTKETSSEKIKNSKTKPDETS
jgi:putative FmdB family regulatory protein